MSARAGGAVTDVEGREQGQRYRDAPSRQSTRRSNPPQTDLPQGFLGRLRSALGPGFVRSVALALEHRRLFVLLPVLAIVGMGLNASLAYDPAPFAIALIGVGLLLALFFARKNIVTPRVFVVLAALWFGFGVLSVHGAIKGGQMLAYPAFGAYSMVVDEVLSATNDTQRLVVSEINALDDARPLPLKRARVFVRGGPSIKTGDQISGRFRFGAVPAPIVPGGFDFQFHAYFDGIGSYASSVGDVQIVANGTPSLELWLDNTRQSIGARLDQSLDQPAQGIARALIIGDQSQIDDQTRSMMAAAGLAHVLAISGLHLTLVAGGVYAVIRAGLALSYGLGQGLAVKKLAAAAGGMFAVFYLALSGASVSATRATIMLLLVFGAVAAGRRALTMRNVAIAALIVIATDPAAVFRPGFQLSFSAVAALIAVYEMSVNRGGEPQGGIAVVARFTGGVALTSLIAGAATVLFAVYHFQQTAPLGVLGNVAALPIVGFVVLPACLLAVLLMPLGMEQVPLQVMAKGTEFILGVAERVAHWSAPFDAAPLLNEFSLVIGLIAIGWMIFIATPLRFVGPLAAIPLIIGVGMDERPDVLVADSSQAITVRFEHGMELVAGRAPSFATTAWQETYMEPIANVGAHSRCDDTACVAKSPAGFSVVLVKRQDGFGEECRSTDLLITRLDAPDWCSTYTNVIDRENLRLGGVHWLKWDVDLGAFELRHSVRNQNRAWRKPF